MIDSHEVDGLMLASIEDDRQVKNMYAKYPHNIVLVNEFIPALKKNSIRLDHFQATLDGLEYLKSKKHTKIAYVTGGKFSPKEHGNTRNRAYQKFLEDNGQSVDHNFVFEDMHSSQDGEKIAEEIIKLESKPDAVFTNSDEVAIGLISKLVEHNIKVPEDIAVMGYDDQPFSKYAIVPVTTIAQPVKGLAINSVKLLLDNLNIDNTIEKEKLKLKIIKRKSA